MKNELLARAITHIDDELIEQANAAPVRRARILKLKTAQQITRWGSIAACVAVMIAVVIATRMSGNDVRLYGESITDAPRTITEFMPRSVTHSVDPISLTAVSLPLELEFDKSTTLTLETGSMEVLDAAGNTVYSGEQYTVKGAVSMCIMLPPDATQCKITTDRGYNIVLELDGESGLWYVSIEK